MFTIEESVKKINGVFIETLQHDVNNGETILQVESGTNGYSGDAGRDAGGRTYLSIECLHGDFYFDPITDEDGVITGIQIAACGDEGLACIKKALVFAYVFLDDIVY